MAADKRTEPRVPVELQLRLAYGSMDDFIERYAMNISRGGIFVRTRDPIPPGTDVLLDIALETGDHVIRGGGVVRWTTPPSAPGEPHRDPGMGIKFTDISRESRALVDLVVATQGGSEARSEEPPLPDDIDLNELDLGVPSPPDPAPAAAPVAAPAATPPPAAEPVSTSVATAPASVPPPPPGAATGAPRAARPAGAGAVGGRPAPRAKPGAIIGIDLGTTNSCAAIARGGKAQVLRSKQGYRTLPSVVAYDVQGRLLVGHAAKGQMVVNPRHTVYGSKRLVGRPFVSPTVQACRDRFHYEIVQAADGAAAVRFAGRDYSLQQVAALILKEIREMASQALGEPATHAVVTVPAHYNDHQRNAVREAGKLAGLHVERIVNEPTAAALAFGYGRQLDQRVLVYDLGGGTFDASVLEIQGDVYEVVSTGGDTFLGGVDFDSQIVDHLVWKFAEQHGFSPPDDRVVWQRIRDAAEDVKVALSSRESAVAHVPYLWRGADGREHELRVEVTRAELETLTERLVDRTLEVCRDVLASRGLTRGDIHEVLLVGGQSRMPLVWRKIAGEFGREPNKSVHPDEAVALGAALLADSASRIDAVVLIDVLAMGIGVGLPGGRMAPVLPRNSKLPARKAYEIATSRDDQTDVELQVFQGDSADVADCEYLGTVRVAELPRRPRGGVKVSVEFAAGPEGLLEVRATDLSTGRITAARLATVDTPASLREKLQLPAAQRAPKGARPLDPAPPSAPAPSQPSTPPAERKGLFGKLFGGRR